MSVIHKPPALRKGDLIAVVAPGSAVPREALEKGVARLQSFGYRVRYRPDILSVSGTSVAGTFAGPPKRRAEEFLEALDDPEVRAIFCARGGYGCNYLVRFLEKHALDKPKIVMGYSDVTTLHAFFWKQAGWVTFHGPMVSTDFSGQAEIGSALSGGSLWDAATNLEVLSPGTAEGPLLGGCLSIIMTTLGTSREIDWRGAIVFLEDIAEAPYRVDRMLFQLKETGKFDDVRGVVFGEMKDCGQPDLLRHFSGMGIPVCAGLASGHTSGPNICLPFGVQARLAGNTLQILEGAVL